MMLSAHPILSAPLPVDAVIDAVRSALSGGRGLVLQAPPGSGKTTRIPLLLMDAPWLAGKKILVLEPRRLAARAAARFMAKSLGEAVGQTVGYHIRMDRMAGPQTRIEVVTEGILTRRLQSDPALEGIGLVIFDEFHERSLHSDLGLALCLESGAVFRPDLRLLVMSATLDAAPAARLLGGVPVVTAGGRCFEVETRYRREAPAADFVGEAARAAARAALAEQGAILVFLPGKKEIRRAEALIGELISDPSLDIFPLFGELSARSQDAAVGPSAPGRRKIVLATSLAETSLTIEGIRVVVDSGWTRVARFDPASGMSRLQTVRVSRAAADQRRGRAGRLEPGVCIRLWDAATDQGLSDYSRPEILDADLAGLALELALWGVTDPKALRWLDPPPAAAYSQARALLVRLEALDREGRITAHGKNMAAFGIHPRLSHMILKAAPLGLGSLACDLAALLGERDIFRGPGIRGADLTARLGVLHSLGSAPQGVGVDRAGCRRVAQAAHLLRRAMQIPAAPRMDLGREPAGLLLAFAFPDRIGQKRAGGIGHYLLSGGRGAFLPEGDPLARQSYLVAAHLDAGQGDARIFLAAPVDAADLEAHFASLIESRTEIFWDDRIQGVSARKRRRLGAVTLQDFPLENPDPEAVSRPLLDGIRKLGVAALPWTVELRNWQRRVLLLRESQGGDSWPDVSDATLAARLEEWLLPWLCGISRLEQFRSPDLQRALAALLPSARRQELERLAPTHLAVPSGSRIRLDYTQGQAPVLAVRLQEMFGQRQTPTVAGGRIPVVVQLLSPAMRPVQVTRDLASFWRNTYAEVRKDLRGRYPKHHWPENPLEAEPMRGAKKRIR